MTELQELQRFLRVVYLRKSLYYSILLLLFSVVEAILLALYNHYFIPELFAFRKIVGILLVLTLVAFLFWPIRYVIQAIWSNYYSLNRVAKSLKSYDNGRLDELTGLSKNELDKWAQVVVLKKVYLELPVFKKTLKKNIPFSTIIWALALLVLTILVSPKSILTEGKDEIVSGTYTREAILLDIKDTVHTLFNEVLELNHPHLTPFYKGSITERVLIRKNETIDWELNGRFYQNQRIICDSIPKLTSWSAYIEPPKYLNLSSYTARDTIKAFKGSIISLAYQGVLRDKIRINVSRETKEEAFVWDGGGIELSTDYWRRVLPSILIEDLPPTITVVRNTNDTLMLLVNDDYGIKNIELENEQIISKGVRASIKIAWNANTTIKIKATDKNNGVSQREVRRPSLSATQLLAEASDQTLRKSSTENKTEKLKKFRTQKQLERESREELTNEAVKNRRYPTKEELEKEPLERLLERLDELWRMEEAVELLSKVDSLRNKELDSALVTAAAALEELSRKETKEPVDLMKNIKKEGKTREEQAQEASKKLKELLANEVAEVQEDNVSRIKRLLKNGWVISVFQESLQELSLAVNKARSQQLVLSNEKAIKDSLDLLLIHEPKLDQLLSEKRTALERAMQSLETKSINGKDIASDVGYAIAALNDINQTLYLLLESEKSNLNQAKKNCKKGKPGSSGKPASAGKGKEGEKGLSKPSKKPGGREKGKSGEPKKGKNGTKPGSTGRPGEKELLKRIEAASEAIEKQGERTGKVNDDLERMKKELLFNTDISSEDLNELEDRLWRVEESVFNKKELGDLRDSESGDESNSQEGEAIDFKVLESKETDLPLPVLKKR